MNNPSATFPPPVVSSDSAAARATNVSKIYGHDDSEVRALDDVTIQFERVTSQQSWAQAVRASQH